MLQAVLRNPHTYHELLRTKTYVLTRDLLDAYVQLTFPCRGVVVCSVPTDACTVCHSPLTCYLCSFSNGHMRI